MSSKRTRDRHLAKQAERRRAEREQKKRQRNLLTIGVALLVGTIGVVLAFMAFSGSGEKTTTASGTPSASASPSASPSGELGTQTGTVNPTAGPTTVACGAKAPKTATQPKPQFAGPPPMTIDPKKGYTATMRTSCGDIVIELLAELAPETVNSFVFLAEQGYFDGQRFHRLANSIDVIQGGDPTATGSGGPGYSLPDELTGKESYGPGVVAMANAGPNTGGSQFFIVTGDKGHLLDDQGSWPIFGRVVKGLDVAQAIQGLPVDGETPTEAVYIDAVTISASA